MNKLLIALVFVLVLLAPVHGAGAQALQSEAVDKIVAVVDEDVILQSELDRAVGNILAQYAGRNAQLPARDVIERQVLERLILMRLQIQRAQGTGIRVTDTELDQAVMRLAQQNNVSLDQLRMSLERDGFSYAEFRDTMRDELTVQRLRQRFVQSRVQVTDTEIDILLASESLKRGEVRLSHILIGVADGAAPEQIQVARARAEMVRKEIDGGLDFASAAIRYSDGQQALEGGDLGWRRFNEVPTIFADLIAGMGNGDVTQPMRGPSGFHILKLVDQREAQKEMVREYHSRHILIGTSELVSSDEAMQSVANLRSRIEAGEDFADLAKQYSEDSRTANLGGEMDWYDLQAYGTRVADVTESLADGEISTPFQTEAGWHVMQRLATRDADVTDDRKRQQAGDVIRNRKAEEEYEGFLRQLRGEAYIENRLAGDAPGTEGSDTKPEEDTTG